MLSPSISLSTLSCAALLEEGELELVANTLRPLTRDESSFKIGLT
jgi:hypothetical protein